MRRRNEIRNNKSITTSLPINQIFVFRMCVTNVNEDAIINFSQQGGENKINRKINNLIEFFIQINYGKNGFYRQSNLMITLNLYLP